MFFRSKFVRFKEVFTEFRLFAKCLVLQELSYFVWLKKTWLSIFVLFSSPNVSFFFCFLRPSSIYLPTLPLHTLVIFLIYVRQQSGVLFLGQQAVSAFIESLRDS